MSLHRFLPLFVLLTYPDRLPAEDWIETARAVSENYANMVLAGYEDSLDCARDLQRAVHEFTSRPDDSLLRRAREKWISARPPYLQTEVYRFYGGPIDDDDGPEVFINSWPIDEAYVDYVDGTPGAGMINDPGAFPQISESLLRSANERGGETMISCGYHAIEFLLWGQDFRDDGPGDRPVTDYTTAKHAGRRAQYLNICSDLLVADLASLLKDWALNNDQNYRAKFLSDPARAVGNILSGVKHLAGTELPGERLLVAWDTQAQEDEHSCFSDTTNQDVIYDAQGLVNVFTGSYQRTNGSVIRGPGLREIARILAPEAARKLDQLVPLCLQRAAAIPVPFDQAILGDRDHDPGPKAILSCVEALEDQAAEWGKVEQKLFAAFHER